MGCSLIGVSIWCAGACFGAGLPAKMHMPIHCQIGPEGGRVVGCVCANRVCLSPCPVLPDTLTPPLPGPQRGHLHGGDQGHHWLRHRRGRHRRIGRGRQGPFLPGAEGGGGEAGSDRLPRGGQERQGRLRQWNIAGPHLCRGASRGSARQPRRQAAAAED